MKPAAASMHSPLRSAQERFARNVRLFGCALLVFAITSVTAQAATVTLQTISSTNPLDSLEVGDQITIGISVSNDEREGVYGLGIQAYGFDRNVIVPRVLELAPNIFTTSVVSSPIGPFTEGGLTNLNRRQAGPMTETSNPDAFGQRQNGGIALITAISIAPTDGTGEFDVGIDGGLISAGDLHARITFEVLGGGTTALFFGGIEENGDGVIFWEEIGNIGGNVSNRDTNVETLILTANGPAFVPEPDSPPVDETDPPVDTDPPLITPPTDGGPGGGGGPANAVPEPSGALLFLVGLASVAAQRRRAAV